MTPVGFSSTPLASIAVCRKLQQQQLRERGLVGVCVWGGGASSVCVCVSSVCVRVCVWGGLAVCVCMGGLAVCVCGGGSSVCVCVGG